jgi:FtsH-binding integral membrane protein
MLKRHFALVNFMRISLDVLAIGILWNAVYYFRFYSGLFDHSGIPSCLRHLLLTVPVVAIVTLCRSWAGIYQSLRVESTFGQFGRQIRSIVLGFMFVVLFLYYSQETPYTRILLVLFLFALLSATGYTRTDQDDASGQMALRARRGRMLACPVLLIPPPISA